MTSADAKQRECSEFLLDLWQSGKRCAALPAALAPVGREEAYGVQGLIEARSSQPLTTWKIAATSKAGQLHIGVDGPLVGRYIAERVVQSGGVIPFGSNHMRVAEVEFAFRFGHALPPRERLYSEAEVLDAVGALIPAIEIPDSRFDQFEKVGGPALIADNACAHWLCLGEPAPLIWRDLDFMSYAPTGTIHGRDGLLKLERQGLGSNVLGSPVLALTWAVNELSSLGVMLGEGHVISTGTCLVPMVIEAGDHVTGDFGRLGRIDVRLD